MYVPASFQWNDKKEIIAFIRQYNFGILISIQNGLPFATHIPFIYEEGENGTAYLLGHISVHNPQVQTLNGTEILAVFHGPHAYVSPTLYSHKNNVPTWNYMAVHVYGRFLAVENEDEVEMILRKTILHHEQNLLEQWEHLPDEYKTFMKKELRAFKMEVTKMEAQKKLSQNKSMDERKRIAAYFLNSSDTLEKRIGKEMMREINIE
jgi:transcriptional regulator